MRPRLQRERLHTVQFVPLTAFDRGGQLNLGPMKELNRRIYDAGGRVFIPCAGSAEFDSLSSDEIVATIEALRESLPDDAVLMVPIGRQLADAKDLGRRAANAGADAALVMPLAFPYLSDSGARDYLLALLNELPVPTLVYKKSPIPSDRLLLELAEHPNMAGVKYAVNDIDAFARVVQDDGGRIDWFCGSAERFAVFFMLAGAVGYTSGAGNLVPRLTLAMHAALSERRYDEAMELMRKIRPIEDYRARADSSYNISFLKQAVRSLGLDFGEPRPPQRRLTSEERSEIDALAPRLLAAEQEALAGPKTAREHWTLHLPTA
jgi:4-hydroxy-tetrahydrodipicolinate synthase